MANFNHERSVVTMGYASVCGVDEVGRGCLAGPLVAGAVVFDIVDSEWITRVNDSKKLSPTIRLELSELIKIKANLSFRTTEKIIHGYHVDLPYECKTAIYYLNTNDGCTMFKDGREVGSVENRLVIFNSQLAHTGTTCTDQKIRSVINFNYF